MTHWENAESQNMSKIIFILKREQEKFGDKSKISSRGMEAEIHE